MSYGYQFSEDDDNMSATTILGNTTIIYHGAENMEYLSEQQNPEGKILCND